MHVVLGVLGIVVTILVLLNRLQEGGIDIGWLNPFSWYRRRKFRKHHDLNPAFKLDSPMDVAALYMVAVAKIDGEMSKEQKEKILSLFNSEFHLTMKEATDLLRSSVHLLGHTSDVYDKPHKVIERCLDKVTKDQAASICSLIDEVANVEGEPTAQQRKLVTEIKNACPREAAGKW